VSMTPEDAWQEEAYDHMVAEILESHKDDIISEFVSERMASYYRSHPDVTAQAQSAIEEAHGLIDVSPTASLVFSRSAVEITLRDVLLKPVAYGMVHDETAGLLIAELVIGNRHFTKLLFSVLENYGLDLKRAVRGGSSKSLWAEMEEIKETRNRIVHYGEKASHDIAKLSLEIATILLHKLYPHLRSAITGE
jgi:hypothetical protein